MNFFQLLYLPDCLLFLRYRFVSFRHQMPDRILLGIKNLKSSSLSFDRLKLNLSDMFIPVFMIAKSLKLVDGQVIWCLVFSFSLSIETLNQECEFQHSNISYLKHTASPLDKPNRIRLPYTTLQDLRNQELAHEVISLTSLSTHLVF